MNTVTDTNTSGAPVMTAAEVLSELRWLGWPDPYDRDVPAGPYTFKRMHTAVAALVEREAALVAERDALKRMWEQAEADITQADKDNAELIAKAETLAAEVEALREDAEDFRWLGKHVAGWHHDDAELPRIVINPRFHGRSSHDGEFGVCSLIVTGHDGVGTVSLREMVRIIRHHEADYAARASAATGGENE